MPKDIIAALGYDEWEFVGHDDALRLMTVYWHQLLYRGYDRTTLYDGVHELAEVIGAARDK